MAQCLLAKMLDDEGMYDIVVDSSATSTEELGHSIHPGARNELARHGIPLIPHRAVQLRKNDLERYDVFIGMDERNLMNMKRILGRDAEIKCFKLLDFSDFPGDIADPWYSGDFTETWNDISEGCRAIVKYLKASAG